MKDINEIIKLKTTLEDAERKAADAFRFARWREKQLLESRNLEEYRQRESLLHEAEKTAQVAACAALDARRAWSAADMG